VNDDASDGNPGMVTASRNPVDLPIGGHINTSRLSMVVHVEDETALRATVTGQLGHGLPPGRATEKATCQAEPTSLLNCDWTITMTIVGPPVLQGNGHTSACREHDASKRDPVMITATSMPGHSTICLHIYTRRLGMVVHVENKTLLWAAVGWQHHHIVAPVAATDETLDLAHDVRLGVCGAAIAMAVCNPPRVCRKSLLVRHRKVDAVQVEPAVMPRARYIVHLSICEHIHTECVLVVVEVEDHTFVWAAV